MRVDVINYGQYGDMSSVGVNFLGLDHDRKIIIECIFPLRKNLKAVSLKQSAKQAALEYLRQAVAFLEADLANEKCAD